MSGWPWTKRELAYLRRHYRRKPAKDIAVAIGRSLRAVYMQARCLGLADKRRCQNSKELDAFIREKQAAGWSDTEMATERHCDRHTISERRKAMGLTGNRFGERHREKLRLRMAATCAKYGITGIAAFRYAKYRREAIAAGWPEDLRPRHVKILNSLWERGPMTRREICDAIGLRWKGSRASLKSKDPEGSFVSHLLARGLIVSLGRIVRAGGKGRNQTVYSLPLDIRRGKVSA